MQSLRGVHLVERLLLPVVEAFADPVGERVELDLGAVALQQCLRDAVGGGVYTQFLRAQCALGGAQVMTGSKQVVVRRVEPLEGGQIGRLDLLGDRHQGLGPFDDDSVAVHAGQHVVGVGGPKFGLPGDVEPGVDLRQARGGVRRQRPPHRVDRERHGRPVSGVASGRSSRSVAAW